MSELTNSDVNLKPFHYKKVNVGYASDVLVMSYTHTGEEGYCLYIPSEYAIHVYEELMKVGNDYGAKDVGTLTQRFMRVERFIPFMGEELNSKVTPLEAGLEFYVDFDKDFLGKEALLKQKEYGIKKRLVTFLLEDFDVDSDVWPWKSEPIFRNSEYIGHVTSACYGFTTNKMVCLGFIEMPERNKNEVISKEFIMDETANYQIDVAGSLFTATPHITRSFLKQQPDEASPSGKKRQASVVRKRQ
jgi:pyruvate dehydrogenase phosphatase regulatory subunit